MCTRDLINMNKRDLKCKRLQISFGLKKKIHARIESNFIKYLTRNTPRMFRQTRDGIGSRAETWSAPAWSAAHGRMGQSRQPGRQRAARAPHTTRSRAHLGAARRARRCQSARDACRVRTSRQTTYLIIERTQLFKYLEYRWTLMLINMNIKNKGQPKYDVR